MLNNVIITIGILILLRVAQKKSYFWYTNATLEIRLVKLRHKIRKTTHN